MARDARAVRAARQRARASARREKRILPKSTTARAIAAPREYALGVVRGEIKAPPKNSAEAKSLARQASLASWGKAPSELKALERYFYKGKEFGLSASEQEELERADEDHDDEEE